MNQRLEGNEQVKAVTLRSDKELAASRQSPVIREVETKEVIQPSQTNKAVEEQHHQKKLNEEETKAKDQPNMTEPTIPILYP